jgi:hypothetical protein
MEDSERTPKASESAVSVKISVDIKDANEASVSEGQTTPTPSKALNANAVEFVPGQFSRPSSVPNPAAPVFTPSFQLTANGYVPINPYAMPYYMYVPTNGAGAPLADGSVVVSPVLTYQPSGGFHPRSGGFSGKGGLSRHNSAGGRSHRSDSGRKDGMPKSTKKDEEAEQKPSSDEPVVNMEDFPSMLGAAPAKEPSSPKGKPSWAAIAKKTSSGPSIPTPTIKSEIAQPVVDGQAFEQPSIVETVSETPKHVDEKPKLVVAKTSEPPKEPAASSVPATGKPKLAPWAKASTEPSVAEQEDDEEAVNTEKESHSEEEAKQEGVEEVEHEGYDETSTETVVVEEVIVPDEEPVSSESMSDGKRVYSIEVLRRLRYHEQCKPSAETKAVIPQNLLRQRATHGSAEEAEDWRAEAAAYARKARNGRLDRRQSSRIEISAEMLIPSENSWSVAQQKKDAGIDENVKVGRKIFAILNKLTVEKFQKLSDQLFTECGISKPAHIITLVKYLFEKATIQHHFIPMYADLCTKCLAWLGSDAAPEELVNSIGPGERSTAAADIFRRVLLERCQEAFYSYFLSHEDETGKNEDPERTEEEHHKHRLSMLGTVKFVAQLLERRLMTRAVFRNCLDTLLNEDERTEDHVECACVFLTEVGRLFERDESAGETPDAYSRALDDAMDELTEIAADEETSARIRFTIMNLVDLRSNKYVVKALPGQPNGPTKISDVHKQAAREEQLVRSISRAQNQSSHSLDEWETVPKKTQSAGLPPTPSRATSQAGLPRAETANPWRMRKDNNEADLKRSSSKASSSSD